MANYNNRFNTIKNISVAIDDSKIFNFNLEQDKFTDEFVINIRRFIKTQSYTGPTKNGLFIKISSYEEFLKLKEAFNELFDSIEEQVKDLV